MRFHTQCSTLNKIWGNAKDALEASTLTIEVCQDYARVLPKPKDRLTLFRRVLQKSLKSEQEFPSEWYSRIISLCLEVLKLPQPPQCRITELPKAFDKIKKAGSLEDAKTLCEQAINLGQKGLSATQTRIDKALKKAPKN